MVKEYVPARSLRSSGSSLMTIPEVRTEEDAAFVCYTPKLWNSLNLLTFLNNILSTLLSPNVFLPNNYFILSYLVFEVQLYPILLYLSFFIVNAFYASIVL